MGLLDYFTGDQPNSLLSGDPGLAIAAGLLGTKRGQGLEGLASGVMNAMQVRNQNMQQERANRQNDLQQLQGLYGVMKQADFMRQVQDDNAGIPHVRDPALDALEQKMSSLSGIPQLSANPMVPQRPPAAPQQAAPQMPPQAPQGPQMSTPQSPQFQVPPPQGQPQAQAAPADPFAKLRQQADLYAAMANKPELIAQNRYKLSQPALSRGVSFDPATGMPIAGLVNNIPVTRSADGSYQVIPNNIGGAVAEREGQVTGAKQAAEFPYRYTEVQTAGGAKVPMPLSSLFKPGGAQPTSQGASPSLPPGVPPLPPVSSVPQSATPQKSDPFADIPKRPVPQGVGQTTYDQERQKKYAEQASTIADSLGGASDAANQRVAFNNEAIRTLKTANTGTLAQQISGVGKLLITMGAPENLVNKAGMDPTATDELNKFLINSATQKAKSIYGARLAQQEVMMQVNQASPALGMTKAAIQTLLNIDNTMANYTIKQANDFGAYDQKGGDPSRFMAWYARKFPLAKELDLSQAPAQPTQGATSGVRRYNPQTGKIE